MSPLVVVAIGLVGGLGATGRFLLDGAVSERVGRSFPWGTLAVNLTGAFLCTQQAFRMMKAQSPRGGRVINNGSIAATSPRPHAAAYAAAKAALTGLTKAASLEGRAFDIACGQVDVGNAATGRTERMKTGVLQANGTLAVEPTMDAKHAASAVAYMASLPLEANVPRVTVMATRMPYAGRG